MKHVFTSIFTIFISVTVMAQTNQISNLVFDPPSPDTLLPGRFVEFTYDYQKTGGEALIGFEIFGTGNYAKSGWSRVTDDAGTLSKHFTYKNGGHVDSLHFAFKDPDWTTFYDTMIYVDYTFHHFSTHSLQCSPDFPALLLVGDTLKINFSYETSWEGNFKIETFALTDEELTPKQSSVASPVYSTATGQSNTFITVDTLATVDQLLFQFLDAATNDTLLDMTWDVFFSFSNDTTPDYTISNVVYTPTSGSIVKLNERVNMTFEYSKPYGDIRIYMDPIVSEGGWNYGHSGSPLYTENIGSGDAFFVFYNEAKIEQLRFRFQSTSGVIIHEHFEDVFFTITADSSLTYSVSNIQMTPPWPATLNTGDTVKISFDYTKPFGTVFFFVRPLKNGELFPGYEIPTLGEFTADSGKVETYIIYDVETWFDQVSIQMKSSLSRLLFEQIEGADYTFQSVPFSVTDLTLSPASPDSINIRDSIKINFIYKNLGEQAKLYVTPLKNGAEVAGYESSNPINLVNNADNVMAFIRFNDITEIDQIKLEILSADETKSSAVTIYEQLIDVNYVFKIPTSAAFNSNGSPSIFPNPAEGNLKIIVPANEFRYSIINLAGQVILDGISNQNSRVIDISNYESGFYFTKINYNGKQFVRKVIFK